MALAPTQYVRSGDADIAFQVIGDGPRDIVLVLDWASHLEAVVEQPLMADFIYALARMGRVLWFDMRGIGMSGHVPGGAPIESWMDDVVAVMNAAGSRQATFFAQGHAAQMALMTAATHPDRVTSLVLFNGFARFARDVDYPAGMPSVAAERYLDMVESVWGTGTMVVDLAPRFADLPAVREWWGRVERYGATPIVARRRMEAILDLDVRNLLPLVQVPTLVIHNVGDEFARIGHGRYLAEHIPGARLHERDFPDHFPLPDDDLIGAIEEFVTGSRSETLELDRFLATVLFADVVGSTQYASEHGDRRWHAALERFEQSIDRLLTRFEGRLQGTAGDGILATFDGPARAIRCAWAIRDDVRLAGLETRCGLHAGEVVRRSADVTGVAVHIGARVSALAAPGEVLVTRTVRDLVAGSGITFEDRGEHELKGIPDLWALYAATG